MPAHHSKPIGLRNTVPATVLAVSSLLLGYGLARVELPPDLFNSLSSRSQNDAQDPTESDTQASDITADDVLPTASSVKQPAAERPVPLSLPESLAVSPDFYYELVDDLFYAQNPRLGERPLTQVDTPTEVSLREEWWQTADIAAANLSQIDVSARRKLGRYSLQDHQQRLQEAERLGIDPVALQNAIAARFQQLFPQLVNDKNGEETSGFQLWCAIAQEEIEKIRR